MCASWLTVSITIWDRIEQIEAGRVPRGVARRRSEVCGLYFGGWIASGRYVVNGAGDPAVAAGNFAFGAAKSVGGVAAECVFAAKTTGDGIGWGCNSKSYADGLGWRRRSFTLLGIPARLL